MSKKRFEELDPRHYIIIKGAKVHNLKSASVAIPRNKFVVITGLSGSGKSSLAFDTLYAEGQRRYVESLSSYARQFLGRLDKPEVEYIKGISPAVAIEQKVVSRSSRSTVGTSTEIYDYLKLLFARIGHTFSPISGKEVKRQTVEDVLAFVNTYPLGDKFTLFSPLNKKEDRTLQKQLEILKQQGYSRISVNNQIIRIDSKEAQEISGNSSILIVIDRLMVSDDSENESRLLDSAEVAFFEGDGKCIIEFQNEESKSHSFSNKFELDGIIFEEPIPDFFSFNNPLGACKTCEGFGSVIGIDPNLVIPNKSLSVFEEAIACWKGEKMSRWKDELIMASSKFDFPIHKPISELTKKQYDLLWKGNKHFRGVDTFFAHILEKSHKIQYRVMLSRYRGKTPCHDCHGSRLRKDAGYVKIGNKGIMELSAMPIKDCSAFFEKLKLSELDAQIAKHLLVEIKNRLNYLGKVGLGYLSLNRMSNTLSGGESQRINLATSLGSSLVGSMYVLDEPSIGLHPRDTQQLIGVLKSLRNLGNTVIVVEHDEEIMQTADYIIDMGPAAGIHGGEVVFEGIHKDLVNSKNSITADYLTGRTSIEIPKSTRKLKDRIIVKGARENNLKNINVEFPLRCMTSVTGVSGSGKSTLVSQILYPALKKHIVGFVDRIGEFDSIEGDMNSIKEVEFVDQNPIGKSSRSNPITYIKAYDEIRAIFSRQALSKARVFKPSHFSFNVAGGRCDTCEGEGTVTIEMQFMADISLLCETCKGKRFKDEILEVEYLGKNIDDILRMTVDEAILFFAEDEKESINKRLVNKLNPLQEVGLGYIGLGQASSTLSGGEAQRVKLASYLSKGERAEHTLFIFDEPTTGLHFDDVKKLLKSMNALITQGHSVIVIEHNSDVIKCSDWVIDLGPEGGEKGGNLVFEGTPAELVTVKNSYTGQYLKDKFVKTRIHKV